MINTLEPTKFSSQRDMNVVKCHLVKQEYWRGMAVLHWRTHQFTMSTRQNDSSEVIGHIIDHVLS